MKLIQLSKGKYAKIDDADYDYLNQWKWSLSNKYAVRGEYLGRINGTDRYKAIFMHKALLHTDLQVDHINGDTLDNQRSNLRKATPTQNNQNRSKRQNTKSIYKGVHPYKNSWRTIVTVNKVPILIGHFPKERWAAMAYDLNASLAFGDFSKPNFPVINH